MLSGPSYPDSLRPADTFPSGLPEGIGTLHIYATYALALVREKATGITIPGVSKRGDQGNIPLGIRGELETLTSQIVCAWGNRGVFCTACPPLCEDQPPCQSSSTSASLRCPMHSSPEDRSPAASCYKRCLQAHTHTTLMAPSLLLTSPQCTSTGMAVSLHGTFPGLSPPHDQ